MMQFILRLSICASLFVLLNCDYVLAASVAWYRFEEGSGSDIIDEVSGTDHGDLIGSETTRLSSGLPTILGGEIANTGAISISGSAWQGILIDGMKFIHHGDGPVPSGDATLEFLFSGSPTSHTSIFWTNVNHDGTAAITSYNDGADRWNIHWNNGSPGNGFIASDFQAPGGVARGMAGPDQIGHDTWHHVALVRTEMGEGQFNWQYFLDGITSGANSVTNADSSEPSGLPVPENGEPWAIGGRDCCKGAFLIDEVRFSDVALSVDDFLLSTPPPASTDFEWGGDRMGDWTSSANWTPAVGPPDGDDVTVTFGGKITQPRTVVVDSAVTVKEMSFVSTHTYAIAGLGGVSLASNTSAAAAKISVLAGDHQFQTPMRLGTDTDVIIAAGTSLTLNNSLDLGNQTLTKSGPGDLVIRNNAGLGDGTLVVSAGSTRGGGEIAGDLVNAAIVSPGDASGSPLMPVPEPAGAVMMVLALTGILMFRSALLGRRLWLCCLLVVVPTILPLSSVDAATTAWYRFEEGSGTDVIDEVSKNDHGDLVGSSTARVKTGLPPVLGGTASNQGAVSISGDPFHGILMTGSKFLHHGDSPFGSGDATLEFLFNGASAPHTSIFWTNVNHDETPAITSYNDGVPRWNIHWNDNSPGNGHIASDFHHPLPTGVNGPAPLSLSSWHHVALVRTQEGNGSFRWQYYLDGIASGPETVTSADNRNPTGLPIPPNNEAWAIGGRDCCQGAFLIDEVRFSDVALPPFRFLTETPAPIPTEFEWAIDSTGDWNRSNNWTPAEMPPHGNNVHVTFGGNILSPRTVATDQAVTVQSIIFANNHTYAIAGTGSVTLEAVSANATAAIQVLVGNHEFQTELNLASDAAVMVGTGTSLTLKNTLNLAGNTMTKTGGGDFVLQNTLIQGGGTLNQMAGRVSGDGTIGVDLVVAGGTVSPGGGGLADGVGIAITVPEPSSMMLVVLMSMGLLGFARNLLRR